MADVADKQQSVRFAPRRLAHANIFVRDLTESLAFYSAVCGLTEVFAEPDIDIAFLSNGSSHHDVALMRIAGREDAGRYSRRVEPGLNHLGWEMENEAQLVDAYKRAKELGAEIARTSDHGMSHSVYMFDPEGNLQEFYADSLADWRGFYRANVGQSISGRWDPLASPPSVEANYAPDFLPAYVEAAPVHPRGISRAAIIAKDFNNMLTFYRDIVGLGLTYLDEHAGVAVLNGATGKPALSLFAQRDGEQHGLHHLTFELVDAVEMEKLSSDLGQIRHAAPIQNVRSRAKQSVILTSPDGVLLEFFVPASGRAWSPQDARSSRDLFMA